MKRNVFDEVVYRNGDFVLATLPRPFNAHKLTPLFLAILLGQL